MEELAAHGMAVLVKLEERQGFWEINGIVNSMLLNCSTRMSDKSRLSVNHDHDLIRQIFGLEIVKLLSITGGSPVTFVELKDARSLNGINVDMLHSAVIGVVMHLTCPIPCGGGHVEHLLL
ncbi:hypothetical protein CDAR_103671 [Caerostris darwini]|uniref:Uncharacterized protein n=1 Tax=Caerostris darwini TaxID=1538125 RepID=A0AAV4PJN9_9ARAC|nr:hypothetical protein CDAR_103671 [Caerostris darwini]